MQDAFQQLRSKTKGDLTADERDNAPINFTPSQNLGIGIYVPTFVPGTALRVHVESRWDENGGWTPAWASPWLNDLRHYASRYKTGEYNNWKQTAPVAPGEYAFGYDREDYAVKTFSDLQRASYIHLNKRDASSRKPYQDIGNGDYLMFWASGTWVTFQVEADSLDADSTQAVRVKTIAYSDEADSAPAAADTQMVRFVHAPQGAVYPKKGFHSAFPVSAHGAQMRARIEVRGEGANFGETAISLIHSPGNVSDAGHPHGDPWEDSILRQKGG